MIIGKRRFRNHFGQGRFAWPAQGKIRPKEVKGEAVQRLSRADLDPTGTETHDEDCRLLRTEDMEHLLIVIFLGV